MTEAELQRAVLDMCRWKGLLAYHTYDPRRSVAGFPDLVIAGPAGVLFRELKSAAGKLEPAQRRWAWMLGQAGQDWQLWRPADLDRGGIAAELAAIGGPRR